MLRKAEQPEDQRELEIALEAAKRATEEALYGPPHLRSGRYHPTPDDDNNEGVPEDEPKRAPGTPDQG